MCYNVCIHTREETLKTYTLTDIIEGSYHHSWSEDRNTLTLLWKGWGYSVDVINELRDGSMEWEEIEMLYAGFEPVAICDEDDMNFHEQKDAPFRTHDYKYCMHRFTLSLPPERKRGARYTEEDVHSMVVEREYLHEEPGMGFSYYNCTEEQQDI